MSDNVFFIARNSHKTAILSYILPSHARSTSFIILRVADLVFDRNLYPMKICCNDSGERLRTFIALLIQGPLLQGNNTRNAEGKNMKPQQHKMLRTILRTMSVVGSVVGISLLISPRAFLSFFSVPEQCTLSILALRDFGAIAVATSFLLIQVSRDPERYSAVINSLIIGLVILSGTSIYTIFKVDLSSLGPFAHPGWLWGKALVRLLLAILLFRLKPRSALSGVAA